MGKLLRNICLLIFILCGITTQAQYLCDYEFKVINKQKRRVKNKCKKKAKEWIVNKRDSLHLPQKLKLSKIKFLAEVKEINKNQRYNKWFQIDSLLCIKKDPEYVKEAIKVMMELQLVVYDIRAIFDYDNTSNPEIRSILNFEFDFNGNLIRAVIRKKKMSPYSETPL